MEPHYHLSYSISKHEQRIKIQKKKWVSRSIEPKEPSVWALIKKNLSKLKIFYLFSKRIKRIPFSSLDHMGTLREIFTRTQQSWGRLNTHRKLIVIKYIHLSLLCSVTVAAESRITINLRSLFQITHKNVEKEHSGFLFHSRGKRRVTRRSESRLILKKIKIG